ncbi:MAG: hypothetical protein KJT01_07220 [Gemmatimonadetes bacterium]|nr:hypothetical protein [Gemmatimonadota bacterium]
MPVPPRRAPLALAAAALLALPAAASAQSGKWVGTVSQLRSAGGSADVTIEPRGEKQSRVRVTVRNVSRDMRIAWDIVEGQCRDNGAPIAPQAAFTQVQSQMDGGGTASANVPRLASGKGYYVRIFDPQVSPTDDNVWGCANLAEKP